MLVAAWVAYIVAGAPRMGSNYGSRFRIDGLGSFDCLSVQEGLRARSLLISKLHTPADNTRLPESTLCGEHRCKIGFKFDRELLAYKHEGRLCKTEAVSNPKPYALRC